MKTERYDSIQALRGIAAFVVVLCHIRFMKGYGQFGVDIFFCISGFIMMHVTQNETKDFLIKRALRILPLYYGITLFTYVAILIKPDLFHSSEATPEYLLKSLLFIPYTRNGITQPILGVGWTLNYEIWFYIIIYLATKINIKYRAVISSAVLAVLVLLRVFIKTDSVVFNFFTDPIILEFALGMLGYILCQVFWGRQIDSPSRYRKNLSLVTICLLIAVMYVLQYRFIFVTRFIREGIPAFLILLIASCNFENSDIPKILIWLGNISFSLYLVHYYTIFFFDRLVYSLDTLTSVSVMFAVIAVAVSIGAGAVSYWLVEKNLTGWLRTKILR